MPAGAMGAAIPNNKFVTMDSLSGPTGSPFDRAGSSQASTGALSTGIGFGAGNPLIININTSVVPATAPQAIKKAGFDDDYQPGAKQPAASAIALGAFMYIGGGRTSATGAVPGVPFPPAPYTVGTLIGGFGNGGSRDAGAGPAFTSFAMKSVTAAGAVATGGVIETGFVNRCGVALVANDSTFGSASAAQAAPA